MSQKNTLFNYFGKSPGAKSSPIRENAPSPARTPKSTASPLSTPKRGTTNGKRAASGLDSPKTTKPVLRDHIIAASPRTRVFKGAALADPNKTHEPHFLRNFFSPVKAKSSHVLSTPKRNQNKENADIAESPRSIFTALEVQEHNVETDTSNASVMRNSSNASVSSGKISPNQEIIISPARRNLRLVRNLSVEYGSSPKKLVQHDNEPEQKESKPAESNHSTCTRTTDAMDVHDLFGQYLAAELRRLNDDEAVRNVKRKVMDALLEVQEGQS